MIKKIAFIIIATTVHALGQSDISLYHLKTATSTINLYNPALVPDAKVFVGLPVVSGIHFGLNNRFAYNDLTSVSLETGNLALDPSKFIASLSERRNILHTRLQLNLLQIGIEKGDNAFHLFINDKFSTDFYYPQSFLDLVWNGNGPTAGETLDFKKLGVDSKYYREYGIGMSKYIKRYHMHVGGRVKMYNGFINAKTDNRFQMKVRTDPESYELAFEMENAKLKTSGIDLLESDQLVNHLIFNGNLGAGIDFGITWEVTHNLSFAVSALDFGFINWKENALTYDVKDTTFSFSGVNLVDIENIEQAIEDSLDGRFDTDEIKESYFTWMNNMTYLSADYRIDQHSNLIATVSNRQVLGKIQSTYALGYRRNIGKALTISANVIKAPQQIPDIGLGLATRLGPINLYLATDHLIKYRDVTQLNVATFHFGINLLFGRAKKKLDDTHSDVFELYDPENEEDYPNRGLGRPKALGHEKIYTIIVKPKKRKEKDYMSNEQ